MRRETSRVSFLMCPFCVRALMPSEATHLASAYTTGRVSARCGSSLCRARTQRDPRRGLSARWVAGVRAATQGISGYVPQSGVRPLVLEA
jgi:hypothetical protein